MSMYVEKKNSLPWGTTQGNSPPPWLFFLFFHSVGLLVSAFSHNCSPLVQKQEGNGPIYLPYGFIEQYLT